MIVLVRLGDFRAAVASVLPHAGQQTEVTPELGRLRFAVAPEDLVVWASDHGTGAVASARVTSHVDGVLDSWDLAVVSCKQALAVFQGPRDKDSRAMWEDGDLRIELSGDGEQVVMSEVDTMLPGRGRLLRVPRVLTAGEDSYPDVPRTVHHLAGQSGSWRAARERSSQVAVEALSKLAASGRAWGEAVELVEAGRSLLALCGARFAGVVPRLDGYDVEAEELATADALAGWAVVLGPLRRPIPPPPPPKDVLDDLARQAAEALASGAFAGRLEVVRAGAVPGDQELPLDHDQEDPR